ncbi:MAG: hypothetical protein OHK005_02900 [Candidatus Methylacidiphilales bacterium]
MVMAMVACGPGAPEEELIILHTGRLGGNVYPLADQRQPGTPLQHYPYLAGYIKAVRAEANQRGIPVLLLDSGDSLVGSFASHVTGSRNVATLFNELGYDLLVLGNLDAELDPAILNELKMPVLNPFANSVGRPAMEGTEFWTRINKGKTAVNVFANFYGDVNVEQFPTRFPMWFGRETGPVVPIRDYAPLAEAAQAKGPGALNVFHWMKFEGGVEAPQTYLEGLKALGMDLIVAHRIYSRSKRDVWGQGDFSAWSIPVSENILRRNQGFTVARADLEKRNGQWRVTGHQLKQMTANTAPADPAILETMAAFGPQVAAANRTVGELSRPMTAEDVLKAYMVALSETAEATTVVSSPESIRTELDAGPLVASSLFDALPWTSPVVRLTLDDGQAAKLRGSEDLTRLERRGAESPVTVLTSRYFGEVLRRELGLRPDQIEVLALGSEYEIFLAFATRIGDLSVLQIPEGWDYVKAR